MESIGVVMFQDIHPHRLDMTFTKAGVEDGDWVVFLRGGQVHFLADAGKMRLPTVAEARTFVSCEGDALRRLFSIDGRGVHVFMGDAPEGVGLEGLGIRGYRALDPSWLSYVGITAGHLGGWYLSNRFCGFCGGGMVEKGDERAVVCGECGGVVYPRISPGVIVGIIDGERILVTRYNRPGSHLTALVAGFMEVGESYEDTIRREVMEEVGLRVGNIRYYKSQPWAFSGSILAGFYVDLVGSPELRVDTGELAEARWFHRDELWEDVEGFSLTAEMIDVFRLGKHPV